MRVSTVKAALRGTSPTGPSSAAGRTRDAKLTYLGRERIMATAQTSGDCNLCHTQSGTSAAPGRIILP
jgi:hypothetical protein